MKKFFLALAVTLTALSIFSSCKKDPVEPSYGVTSFKVTIPSGQSYNFELDQTTLKIENSKDTIPIFTQEIELKAATLTLTHTTNATVTVNGQPYTDGMAIDLTQSIAVKAICEQWYKSYSVNIIIGKVNSDLQKGQKMIADFRNGGISNDVIDFDVVYLNGQFYMFAHGYNSDKNYNTIYSSANGTKWEQITPNVSSGALVGGLGARAVVNNGKAYLFGGARLFGVDEKGGEPEAAMNWGMLSMSCKSFRGASTSDFSSFTDLTGSSKYVSATADQPSMMETYLNFGSPSVLYPSVISHNGKIFYRAGGAVSYGQFQFNGEYLINSTDGQNWTEALLNDGPARLKLHCISSFFSFKNKLWIVGGYSNFISPGDEYILNSIATSTDGATWQAETPTENTPRLVGATVVVNKSGNTAYMFGGVNYNETEELVASNKVYKSTDGINWTAIDVKDDYIGGFSPAVVVDNNNIAWVFTRSAAAFTYYGYSTDISQIASNIRTDVWAFALDE